MPTASVRVVFTPSGRAGAVNAGTTVLDAAREMGVDLDSVCGGRGICGRCQVVPSVGSFPKWAITAGPEALSSLGAAEAAYEGRRPLGPSARLGCQARVQADVVVDVPPESQLHGPVVRKTVDVGDIALDPLATLHAVTVPPPTLDERRGLAEVVIDCVADEWGVHLAGILPGALAALHASVAAGSPDDAGGRLVTVAVRWSGPERSKRTGMVTAVWPGVATAALGVAIDVGSTTIAGHLTDLHSGDVLASAGRMNPQIRLGEDLMSRVSYVMMNPGGAQELTALVRDSLAALITELCSEAGAEPDAVLEVVLVGNPIMMHIALGIDPTPLGQAPFTLATDASVEVDGPEMDLPCPAARVYVAPAIAGHVGADTAAAVLAGGPHRDDAVTLLVDVGTNAEIVLGSSEGLWAASSPTGPAFEGAQISCGQRATPGAIERVRIDPVTWAPRVRVIGCDLWSDEPGFAEAVERRVAAGVRSTAAGVTGLCGSGIIEVIAEMYLAGVLSSDGVIAAQPGEGERASHVASDGRTSSFGCTSLPKVPTGRPSPSPRTMCEPSNWRRRRCAPASTCCAGRLASRLPTECCSPEPSGRTSIRYGRWCSGSSATATRTGCGRSATQQAPALYVRCCQGASGPRWSEWSAASARSRLPPSRGFRSSSWQPWHSLMPPHPLRCSRRRWTCPAHPVELRVPTTAPDDGEQSR